MKPDTRTKFNKIYVEISDICSCKCSFCPSHLRNSRRGAMSLELFYKILKEISPFTKRICLHLLGEPLEVANLKEFVYLVQKFELHLELVTTGKRLNTADFAMLLNKPFYQISISLSAFFDEKNRFKEDYLNNLLEFCDFHRDIKSDVFINLRVQSEFLLTQNDKFKLTLEKISQHFGLFLEDECGKIIRNFKNKIFEKNTKIRLGRKIFLNFKTSFEWKNSSQTNTNKSCHGLSRQLGILSNGVVVPCCMDYEGVIALGDINSQKLDEILASKRANVIKAGFKNGVAVEDYCKSCGFITGVS